MEDNSEINTFSSSFYKDGELPKYKRDFKIFGDYVVHDRRIKKEGRNYHITSYKFKRDTNEITFYGNVKAKTYLSKEITSKFILDINETDLECIRNFQSGFTKEAWDEVCKQIENTIKEKTKKADLEKEKSQNISKEKSKKTNIFKTIKFVFICVLMIIFLKIYPVIAVCPSINTDYMSPTLKSNDKAFVSAIPISINGINRGDIVFADNIFGPSFYRVVGLPKETIEQRSDGIYINGSLLEETYVDDSLNIESKNWEWSFDLKDDEYFLLFDNRDSNRLDSRVCGPISSKNITRKVLFK